MTKVKAVLILGIIFLILTACVPSTSETILEKNTKEILIFYLILHVLVSGMAFYTLWEGDIVGFEKVDKKAIVFAFLGPLVVIGYPVYIIIRAFERLCK